MIKYKPTENKLQAGEHIASVKIANEGHSAKGDQTIELELNIGGFTLRDTLYNTEAAAWRIRQARVCFGFDDAWDEEIEFNAEDLVGCTGRVQVDLSEPKTSGKYEGKSFLEVQKYLPRTQDLEPDPDNIPF
jgi:hypothetical protein